MRRRIACLGALGLVSGCLGSGAAAPPPVPETAPPLAGALRVRLVFGAEADLDLYVSGPARETVYFANERSSDGGRLERDERCDAPAPRVETVVFEDAAPALYRIGVDFMVRCDGATDAAPYRLVVEAPGRPPESRDGVARFGAFDTVVWEVPFGGGTP